MSSIGDFKLYLDNEVNKKITTRLAELRIFSVDGHKTYLTEDIMRLLNIKSIWNKTANLIDNQEKFNRIVGLDGVSRMRTLITKEAVGKIILSMRKQPHKLIRDHFVCKTEETFEVSANNIYIKRLMHIFHPYGVGSFIKVKAAEDVYITIDIFIPKNI